jgi:NADPH:quinone reductase-like Zn-dependent oxidoreductase
MKTMRALVYDKYGPPETLRLEHLPQPKPAADEVLVRVHLASVNSWDWDLMVGTAMGRITSPFRPPHKILGADIAGTVQAIGADVASLKVGDTVFGDLSEGKWGGFAELVCAKASALAIMPDGLSVEHAAALPQAGCLALQSLRRRPTLGPADAVLIIGAGGGVGTLATQMAMALGARVTAVDRAEKRQTLLELGADAFIDYQTTDVTSTTERFDLIIDVVARHGPAVYARMLKDGGNLVVVGGTVPALLQVAAFGWLVGRRRQQKLELLIYRASAADNLALAERCLAGTLTPVIDSVYPLEGGAAALRHLGEGKAIGKVLIAPTTSG